MHFHTNLTPWTQGVAVILALLAGAHANAQTVDKPVVPPVSSTWGSWRYTSPLEGYQRYADTGLSSWVQSNQTVQEIGGWKAYAKEAVDAPQESKRPAPPHHDKPMGHSHGKHP
jgi:hypothetical protein